MLSVDVMRYVDRYVGVPLCFLFSVLDKAAALFQRERNLVPRKILVMQLSEMGSTVLVRPAVKYIKQHCPDAEIFYLIFDEMKASLLPLDMIPPDHVHTIRSGSLTGLIKDSLKVLLQLRKHKLDAAIDLELFSRYSMLLSYLSGARARVGFDNFHAEGLYRGSLLTQRVHYNYYKHISLNFLALFKSLEAEKNDFPLVKQKITGDEIDLYYIESTPEAREKIWAKLKKKNPDIHPAHKRIVLNPNASALLPLRRWPLEKYIGLTEKLLEHPDWFVILTGVLSDLPDVLQICEAVKNKRCINLATETTLPELIDLYNISDVLISNDSGPPHFASLTPIRVIVLFGPETPRMYAPLSTNLDVVYLGLACSPCVSAFSHRKSACTNNRCLQMISVDDVYSRVVRYLDSQ